MSNMKCPFCQQELEEDYLDVQLFGCENQNCKHWINNDIIGTKELWQELIRTRKALDCAINTLDTVYGMSEDDGNIETYIKCKKIEINRIIKGEQ